MASTLTNPNYQPTGVRYTPSPQLKELQGQVDEVVEITKDNLRLGLERGIKLDDLESKAEELNQSSQGFARTSRKMKRTYQWKNFKMWIILGILITIILVGIIVGVIFGIKNKK